MAARTVIVVFAMALAAGVSVRLLGELTARPVLRARNYRGLELPLGSGVAILGGTLIGWGALDLLGELLDVPEPGAALPGFVLLAFGFGFLGLFDDMAGSGRERGWKAHVGAVRAARATPGALKLVGGIALALIVAPAPDGFLWGIARGALIALTANLVNLLDLRPGRASKAFIVGALALGALSMTVGAPLAVAVAATVACLRADLRERIMLGDVGANALGAILGAAAVVHASHTALLIAIGVLGVLHALADRPGLSVLIDKVPPLRRADRAGRALVD
jgi:UDP-N-acetylmuramyl pentapeptide phosphotransferase/UDP-N-acetylglucosamine-1-phosphate transferase